MNGVVARLIAGVYTRHTMLNNELLKYLSPRYNTLA